MTEQPPVECPKPLCYGFAGISIGQTKPGERIWAACTSCCGRRKDWEDFLNQESDDD